MAHDEVVLELQRFVRLRAQQGSAAATRLLKRGVEMKPVFENIAEKLQVDGGRLFLDACITAVELGSPPDRLRETSLAVADASARLRRIAKKARDLAEELLALERATNDVDWPSEAQDPMELIDRAGGTMYRWHVGPYIKPLRGRFINEGYWPSMDEVLDELARLVETGTTEALCEAARSALRSRERGWPDILRALTPNLDHLRHSGLIPKDFDPSSELLATVLACALELGEPLDAEAVRKARARWRA
ncbi:MAG: hypothetical protein JNL68_07735 [Burkholderiales bacterium]|nr:hypothetical protein [Burkholderiales bacterium]